MISALGARFAGWPRRSVHGRIASAAAIVALFTFGGKLAGALKEVLVAQRFGTADEVDAFLIAFLLPSFAITVVGSSLNAALLPAYVEVRQRDGHEAAQRLFSTAMVMSIVLLVVAALALAAIVPATLPLLAGTFGPEKLRLTRELSYLLVPQLVIAGTITTWTAVLNAHGRFAAPAAASLATPIVSIAVLVLGSRVLGIHALAVGITGGYLVEAALVGIALRREGISIRPRWAGWTPAAQRVAAQFAPMAAGMLAMGTNPIIDQLMAARLDAGSVASLGYGGKLVAFGVGIGTVSLGAAVLPHFSQLAAQNDWNGLHRNLRTYAAAVLAVSVPATLALVALSQPIVRVLFERGAFTREDTLLVARIQAFYLGSLPFRLTNVLFVRFIQAAASNRVLMWIALANAVLNVAANWILSRYLGAAGIALSTTLVYAFSFSASALYARRRLRELRGAAASIGIPEPA